MEFKNLVIFAIIDIKKHQELNNKEYLEYYTSNLRNSLKFMCEIFNHKLTKSEVGFIDYIESKLYLYEACGYDKIPRKVYLDLREYHSTSKKVDESEKPISVTVEFGNVKV